jgi:ATP-dependent Clp protease ATP-binding subunit ClpA
MFERFTDRARRVVVLAQAEARLLQHDYIGTEHILLGLIQEGDGVAAQALDALGVELETVRSEIVATIGEGSTVPTGHIPFTPRAKKVLELSLREALQLGHDYIGTEHLLLGLLREGEGVAAQVLQKLGVTLGVARQEVVGLLAGYAERSGEETPEGRPREARLRPGRRGTQRLVRAMAAVRRTPEEPERRPVCPRCEAGLLESARFRVEAIREQEGEGTREAAFVFCAECGRILAAELLGDLTGDGLQEGSLEEEEGLQGEG